MKNMTSGMRNDTKNHDFIAKHAMNKGAQMTAWAKTILILIVVGTFLSACSSNPELAEIQTEATAVVELASEAPEIPTNEPPATPVTTPALPTVEATQVAEEEIPVVAEPSTNDEASSITESANFALPERSGPQTQTTGSVPHIQIGVNPVQAVNDELYRRAFTLPGVEDRSTTISLPGARGMWLSDNMELARPEVIVNGREFAHFHPDGSLHASLPFERALELTERGWGERHPWADEREGWDGFVMLYTPITMEELEITFQLIVESYNHVTGLSVQASDIE